MGAANIPVVVDDLSGGLNLSDAPMSLAANQVPQAVNVEWVRTKFGRRRRGSSAVTATFAVGGPFTTPIGAMVRHVRSIDETDAEVWAVDSTPLFARKFGVAQFAPVTPADALTGNAWDVTFASVDGCLFVSYQSAVNRLHVWDGTSFRRAGIDPGTNAPTETDLVAVGTYPATFRWYRVRFYNSATNLISEPTPPSGFTPTGVNTGVRVTRPAAPGEGENAWTLEASADGVTYYQLSAQVLATTFYDDSSNPAGYASVFTVSPLTGTFNLQKSYRFIAGANNRLLGFGTWQTGTGVLQNRVEMSGIVGAITLGPFGQPVRRLAETVDTTAGWYVDLDENDSGTPTGLKGPVFGNFYAFKSRQMWELRPTGDSTRPFAATAISKTIGAVNHQAICSGEDESGREALYFWSFAGPYRYTVSGLQYIGRPIEGIFKEEFTFGDVNFDSTIKIAHCQYHPDNKQVYFCVATSALNDPNLVLVYHCLTGGWSQFVFPWTGARCSAMLPDVQGLPMSRRLKPHFAPSPVVGGVFIVKADDASTITDAGGTAFSAEMTTRPILPGGAGGTGHVGNVQIVGRGSGSTLTCKVLPNLADYAPIERSVDVSLTPTAEEGTRVIRVFEDTGLDEVQCAQYHILDSVAAAWVIDRLVIPVRAMGSAIT